MARMSLRFLVVLSTLFLIVQANNHDLNDILNTRTTCRRANEVFSSCGKNSCQNTCRRPNASATCTSNACIPGCVCAPGYVRSTRHACVLPNQCTTTTIGLNNLVNDLGDHKRRCTGANEIFSNCGQDGCQRTCTRLDITNCNPICSVPDCICVAGFVRNALGLCVLPAACTAAANNVCTGQNEVFSQCGNNGCQRTCNTLDVTGCTAVCSVPACVCADGFVRNAAGACVAPSQCPANPTCTRANEVFSQCGNTMCQVTCFFTAAQAAACTAPCNSGCICAPGFLRNNAGSCVPQGQCNTCTATEQLRTCGAGVCEGTCATPDFTTDPRCSTAGACTSRCFCLPGTVRNTAGACVVRTQC